MASLRGFGCFRCVASQSVKCSHQPGFLFIRNAPVPGGVAVNLLSHDIIHIAFIPEFAGMHASEFSAWVVFQGSWYFQ
ncbi:hypothetical protein MKJ04_12480 [Pontibacter sp. E15-1]|uniref:hypothetical protein n=1 Tax=Pontibacter sp. E15-1 TaxID=2919918 RepID=UPI001F502211|nr:hypothetical protein [Pontibacter sp. E15-1]MCJ8165660.1 hypothetical protein [Pontibacter sp. E15-1]